jgi:proteasome assembly chaperone (PAC2) family protein
MGEARDRMIVSEAARAVANVLGMHGIEITNERHARLSEMVRSCLQDMADEAETKLRAVREGVGR